MWNYFRRTPKNTTNGSKLKGSVDLRSSIGQIDQLAEAILTGYQQGFSDAIEVLKLNLQVNFTEEKLKEYKERSKQAVLKTLRHDEDLN